MLGETISHYKIIEKLGQGGMGEVYLAHDTTIDRDVAIKMLPPAVAADGASIARFRREARALGQLNHPGIATIFDFEEVDGSSFLVMELVDGESLAQRLERQGRFPVTEALEAATQIARALEAAHEQQVVHRDLKPANAMITTDGSVKLLDFGLARMHRGAWEDSPAAVTRTIELNLTQPGTVVGTAAYMSPEQARGASVDRRTDVWAFGCLLFELLAGARAFRGSTMTDVVAGILESEPEWDRLPADLPRPIRRLLGSCLVKDSRRRLQWIGDARLALEEFLENPDTAKEDDAPVGRGSTWRAALPWLLLPAVALAAWLGRPSSEPAPQGPVRFEIGIPDGRRLASFFRHGIALSPDGRTLAFVGGKILTAYGKSESTMVYLRSLDQRNARAIPGTEGARQPVFSPDGNWIAFQQQGYICKVPVAGGDQITLPGPVRASYGMTWTDDGSFVFASGASGLVRMSDSGGAIDTLTALDEAASEVSHRLPHALPGGRGVLFSVLYNYEVVETDRESQIWVHSSVDGQRRLLIERGADARYLSSGHLMFVRKGQPFVVPFDLEKLEVVGDEVPLPIRVVQSLETQSPVRDTAAAQIAVSRTGVLAFAEGSTFPQLNDRIVRVDRRGQETALGVKPEVYLSVRVSPDGNELLLSALMSGTIWIHDLRRGIARRQTFDGDHTWAIWGPGADEFTTQLVEGGTRSVAVTTRDSEPGQTVRLHEVESPFWIPASWSSKHGVLALTADVPGSLEVLQLDRQGNVEPLLGGQGAKAFPEFSPDGDWIAYLSSESGRNEIYVRPFPGPGRAVQVSTNGGISCAWSRDGREIVYRNPYEENRFYVVSLRFEGDELLPDVPVALFDGHTYTLATPNRGYDLAPDGSIIALKKPTAEEEAAAIDEFYPTSIQIVLNWFAELESMVSGAN